MYRVMFELVSRIIQTELDNKTSSNDVKYMK